MPDRAEETLVTQDMIDRKDVWGSERLSPPISESDIRKWAIATYWPDKPPSIYWDADYAKGTKYEGIIAPPDFNLRATSMPVNPNPTIPQTGGPCSARTLSGPPNPTTLFATRCAIAGDTPATATPDCAR